MSNYNAADELAYLFLPAFVGEDGIQGFALYVIIAEHPELSK